MKRLTNMDHNSALSFLRGSIKRFIHNFLWMTGLLHRASFTELIVQNSNSTKVKKTKKQKKTLASPGQVNTGTG